MRISFGLSVSEINNAIKEIEDYRQGLEYKLTEFCERLSERGVQYAQAGIASYDAIFRGDLLSSIRSEQKESGEDRVVFAVVTDDESAFFVEFGTGVVGAESPYPYDFPDGVSWEYASGETIHELPDGRIGWFYYLDGKRVFTEGMPSRPFMGDSAAMMRADIEAIAKEVFGT